MTESTSQNPPKDWIYWLSKIVQACPVPLRKFWSSFIAFLWWDLFSIRKAVVYRNLSLAFRKMSRIEKLNLGRESIRHLSGNFIDLMMIPAMDIEWIGKNVTITGEEHLREALSRGHGVLTMSLHSDNGDTAVAALAMRGYKLRLITKHFKSKWLDQFWFRLRSKPGVVYMDPHGSQTAYQILSALRRNEMLVFVTDQQMGPPYGVKTKFFGRSTGTAYGLALFALRTQAPVLPIYIVRDENWHQHLIIEPEIKWSLAEGLSRDEQVAQLTQELVHRTEEIILRHPRSWMWVHRRWKDFY